jgi:hypothetical protein
VATFHQLHGFTYKLSLQWKIWIRISVSISSVCTVWCNVLLYCHHHNAATRRFGCTAIITMLQQVGLAVLSSSQCCSKVSHSHLFTFHISCIGTNTIDSETVQDHQI